MRHGDFSWLFLILFIGAMLFLRWYGWGGCCGMPGRFRRSSDNDRSEALKILKQRYAKGEISESDYERMKQKLNEK